MGRWIFPQVPLREVFPAARCCGPMQAELLHTLAELFSVANLSSDSTVRDTWGLLGGFLKLSDPKSPWVSPHAITMNYIMYYDIMMPINANVWI